MTDDYKVQAAEDNTLSNIYTVTGTHSSIISARVSYAYNLTGPALTLDTACSSSLVAIDVASQALQTGTVYIPNYACIANTTFNNSENTTT
jgi:acyl transferase domain-containing protein